MKHTFLTVLLTLGVVGGLAAGFGACHHRAHHRDQFEAHIADVCVGAARRQASDRDLHSHAPPGLRGEAP